MPEKLAMGPITTLERGLNMLTVDVNQLIEALIKVESFSLPKMNEGTEYLYNNLYLKLSEGEDVKLSNLDFNAFEPEDITLLTSLYSDVFEKNSYMAQRIICTLHKVDPVCKAVDYI